ncbi:MAG TPA: Ig-like domain-containing protein [Gemmatimonadaceae bacterium]|nr:Ig-like domain-containing protein [Gemmatimonadaceae bacterium]
MSRILRFPCAVLALAALAGCFPEGQPTAQKVDGASSSIAASASPTSPSVVALQASPRPAVVVKDKNGKPMANQTVTFAIAAGNGSVTGASVVTGRDGIATVGSWTLGTTAGDQKLSATTGSLPAVIFTVSAKAAAAAQLSAVNDGQQSNAGSALANPVGVLVKDSYGNLVSGANVSFAPNAGSGSVNPASAASDVDGKALTQWTLGTAAGPMKLVATLGSLPAVNLTATATSGVAASVARQDLSDNQTGTVGVALSRPVGVIVKDQYGNPVQGVSVSFAPANGSSVQPASASTDASGMASTSWTMGTVAGQMNMNVTAGSLAPVAFVATAKAGPPAQVSKAGDGQFGTAGKPLAQPVSVTVSDQYGNLVEGAAVSFAAGQGSSASPTSANTNASGVASSSWTMPTTVGVVNMSVSVASLPAVGFVATSQADVPVSMQKITSGDNQVGETGSTLPQPVSVVLRDQYGNAVPGYSVDFTAGNGGSASPASMPTNADGQATATWTLGPVPGAHTLTASYASLSQTFNATANAPSGGCQVRGTLGTNSTVGGDVLNSSCMYNMDRARVDLWSFSLSASTPVEISLNATDEASMDTYLNLYRNAYTDLDHIIAFNDDDYTAPSYTTNSKVKLLGGAGTFLVGATYLPGSPGQTGSYSLLTRPWTGRVTACEEVYVLPGSSTNQHLDGGDCVRNDGRWSDNVIIYLHAGEQIRVDMAASTFDAKLEIDDRMGTIASDDNSGGGTNPQLNFTAPSDGYYIIAATAAAPNKGGDYTFAVTAVTSSGLRTSSLRTMSTSSRGGIVVDHSVKQTKPLNKR